MPHDNYRNRGNNNGKTRETAFIENLLKENYILIIGSEVILEKNAAKTQRTGDSMFRIYNAIADNFSIKSRPETEKDWQHQLKKIGLGNQVCCTEAWKNIFDENSLLYDGNIDGQFSSDLKEFLEFKLFPIIITTCIDDLLEVQLRKIYEKDGIEPNVYNFMDDQEIIRFIDCVESTQNNKMDKMKPSLIYLFGKIGDKNDLETMDRPFVFTEDDAIESIARYITKPEDNLGSFFDNYLFKHPVLTIGCRFDDWRFRFFWYAIRGAISEFSKGTVAYTCLEEKNKDNLFRYLEQENVYVEPDSRAFLKKMNGLMRDKDTLKEIIKRRVANAKGIFLSYASEDFDIAYKWFRYLSEECHFNVWIDREDLHANDVYSDEIKKNIDACGIFMPILSEQVQKDLSRRNLERYYIDTEWQYARDNKKEIFPVSVNSYDFKKDYHRIFIDKTGLKNNDKHIESIFENKEDIVQSLKNILLNK